MTDRFLMARIKKPAVGRYEPKLADGAGAVRAQKLTRDMPEASARLWAWASHDLCQPVQGALLLSTLLGHACENSEHKQTVERLESALRGLQERLDVLSVLARLESGLLTVAFRACPINEVIGHVLRDMTVVATGMGKTVTIEG